MYNAFVYTSIFGVPNLAHLTKMLCCLFHVHKGELENDMPIELT
jgi:hypothetical protein